MNVGSACETQPSASWAADGWESCRVPSYVHRQGDLEQQEAQRDVLPSRILVDLVCARFNICQTIVFMFTYLVELKWQGDNQHLPSLVGGMRECLLCPSKFMSVSASTLLRGIFDLLRQGEADQVQRKQTNIQYIAPPTHESNQQSNRRLPLCAIRISYHQHLAQICRQLRDIPHICQSYQYQEVKAFVRRRGLYHGNKRAVSS
jgi:hypothetical protein